MLTVRDATAVHEELRDRIADTVHREFDADVDHLYALVLVKGFTYAFNTYKAIGHLLPDCFYEQGAALLRILWETTLNLAWVTRRPAERSKLFLQFTVVEKRRFLQFRIGEARRLKRAASLAEAEAELKTFDEAFARILTDYRLSDRRERRKLSPRFSGPSLEDVAGEMGGEWAKEYRDTYPLLCFYAHASPGVVIFPNPFLEKITAEAFEEYDQTRTVRLALSSMAVMERAYRMTWPVVETDDSPVPGHPQRSCSVSGGAHAKACQYSRCPLGADSPTTRATLPPAAQADTVELVEKPNEAGPNTETRDMTNRNQKRSTFT